MTLLLTLADIAELCRCSERHARDVIVRAPDFPRESRFSTPRKRTWLRSEVVAYAKRKPEQRPNNALKAA